MPTLPLTTQASGTIIPSPGPGRFIRVLGGDLALSAAGSMTLKSSATVIWNTTSQTAFLNVDKERTIDCVPNDPLVLVPVGGTVTGSLEYVVLGTVQ